MDRYQGRRDKLRKLFRKAGVDGLLVTNFTNVSYLTGFTGDDSYLLVGKDKGIVLSDPRYTTQLEEECPGIEVAIRAPGRSMLDVIGKVTKSTNSKKLGVEGEAMSIGLRDKISMVVGSAQIVPTDGLVEQLRIIKDKEEVDAIRRAVWVAEKAL